MILYVFIFFFIILSSLSLPLTRPYYWARMPSERQRALNFWTILLEDTMTLIDRLRDLNSKKEETKKKGKHIHQFKRIRGIWCCVDPYCGTYLPGNVTFIEGRATICNGICRKPIVMDKVNMADGEPMCEECIRAGCKEPPDESPLELEPDSINDKEKK